MTQISASAWVEFRRGGTHLHAKQALVANIDAGERKDDVRETVTRRTDVTSRMPH